MENQKIKKFTDLITWQQSHKLVLLTYKITENFPADERFGLTNQMRRAAISITSNIAEGFGRSTSKDKANFYSMAKSSLAELENQYIASRDLKYLSDQDFLLFSNQALHADKLIAGLYKSAAQNSRVPILNT